MTRGGPDGLSMAWSAGVRRRRLIFIVTTAPGVGLGQLGGGVLHQPFVFLLGVGLVLAALVLRATSEPRLLARERRASARQEDEAS